MTTPALDARAVAAAWLVVVPAAALSACTVVALVALGPFALIALPFALPPLAVVACQARTGYRVARGRSTATRALCLLTVAVAVALALLAVYVRPEDGGGPGLLNVALGLSAAVEAVAVVLLVPSALAGLERPPASRVVGLALAALAVAQVAALTFPRASTSPLP